ncbi:hypothetical protein I3760_04G191800 [Carya illinoinensis]|nr:hypothetical protein I3760_04G191800 [Carya illinoinensis]
MQNLTNLEVLRFSYINISSTFLTLDGCRLYERFPTRIFQLPHLQELDVSYNEDLTGHLPEFHTNSPLEAIPNSFSNLTHLTGLDLSQNSFNDLSWLTRPSSNYFLPQFEYLGLAHLNLTKFPDILRNQSKLEWLYLEGNNLQGLIPKWMYNPNLEYLYLDNNKMHGSLRITPPSIMYYSVRNNSFTGRISPFICNMSSPVVLDLSYNYLSSTIHPCLGNLNQTYLSVLVLRRNNFGGTIPKTWAKGCLLRMLDLSENQLQGHLPRSLANCTQLEYLHVGHNQINDTYPFWLGTLQQLKILVFHSNGFHCAIWTIKGVELEYKKIHDDLKVIDFSCNRFEGQIPKQVGNLKGLHVLNLSNNALTGRIPSSFGNLTQLESLDLSRNKLFGEIPPELVQLNFLSMYNVSHNGLTGPIPQGQQFGTFQNTSFEDNQGLCGRPLSKICGDFNNQGARFVFEFGWKVVVMGYRCEFVFGVVIGHIVTTRKQDWVIKIFGKKQRQTRICRVNRRK